MTKEVTMAQVADKALDKTDALITKVAEVSGNMFEAAANLITKGIEQYGQQAIDAVLWVVRIDAMQTLLQGFIFVIISIVSYKLMRLWYKKASESDYGDIKDGFQIIMVIAGIVMLVAGIMGFDRVTNVWTYTAVVKPELYLVKKTVEAVELKLKQK